MALDVTADVTATSRCDEGFLHVRRRRLRNRYADGTTSREYPCDVVERPGFDAVAVLAYERTATGAQVLLRRCLRPAVYFRQGRQPPLPGDRPRLFVWEAVAGVLEPGDVGEAGLVHRAAEELREEAGLVVSPDAIVSLGAAFFPSPGILSERIYTFAVETRLDARGAEHELEGDGSPLEDRPLVRVLPLDEALAACGRGELEDAKTEIALWRLASRLGAGRAR
jgi:ADP-ribose pyrophosphatase